MAIVTSRTQLSQGQSKSVASCVFATGTGADIRIHTGAANNLPALAVGEFFEVRDHSSTQNNGLYKVVTVTTSTDDYECDKMFGSAPVTAGAETVTTLGATGASTEKSVYIDTAIPGVALLEQGNVTAEGANGTAMYSFLMQEYKQDDYLLATGTFPMRAIDNDAGKYLMGQEVNGVNSGATWLENTPEGIRTRKVLRNMGWNEIDTSGNIIARYAGVLSVDALEDAANDTGFYQFGTDTAVDDTVDLTFAGPANEAVKFFEEIGNPDTCNFATSSTITRASGSFITDGYKVGGQVTVRNADNAAHNGTYVLTGVAALTLTVTGTPFTGPDPDTNAILAVNNGNAFRLGLRVRDADPNGKTFAESNLTTIDKAALGNFVFQFPMANGTDLKISETDANIDANTPYTGMSITFHSTPQARGGLVGGPYNFGIIVNGNNGTNIQVHEFIQRSLRKLTDIDAGAGTAIGRAVGLMSQFIGDELQVGDIGATLVNPQGGGTGVFIDSLNAASDNSTVFKDNTGVFRAKPESITITHDFNQVAIDDALAISKTYFDRTIRTPAATLTDFVLTSGTNKMTSAGTNLPTNAEIAVGKYIRISGLTGGDAAMNGVYQIQTITTPGADWTVARYDGAAIVSVASTAVDLDQNCVDTPDAIVVHTNTGVTNTDISFTTDDTITSAGSEFGVFAVGDFIEVIGTASNDGIYEIETAAAGSLTTVEKTISTEASGSSFTIQKLFQYNADADQSDNFAFDDNVQGGRSVSTTTYVKAKAIGAGGAQYLESAVTTIASGTPVTIPLFTAGELNYV